MIKGKEGVKRAVDIVVSLLGLVVLSPVCAVIAWLVRCCIGAPIIFRQQRPGITGWAQVNGRNVGVEPRRDLRG